MEMCFVKCEVMEQKSSRKITVADMFSFSRLLMLIPITYLGFVHEAGYRQGDVVSSARMWMIVLYVLLAFTDFFDGWAARKWGGSKMGKYLDPAIDKFIFLYIIVLFSWLPWSEKSEWKFCLWYAYLVPLRDLLILLILWALHKYKCNFKMVPNWSSKLNTVIQFFAVGWVLLPAFFFTPQMAAMLSLPFLLKSAIDYAVRAIKIIKDR